MNIVNKHIRDVKIKLLKKKILMAKETIRMSEEELHSMGVSNYDVYLN